MSSATDHAPIPSDRVLGALAPWLLRVTGRPPDWITRPVPLGAGNGDHQTITFCDAGDPHGPARVQSSGSGAVLCGDKLALDLGEAAKPALLVVTDPRRAFIAVLELFAGGNPRPTGVHPTALVDPHATIAPDAWVGPFCCVAPGCSVGPQTTLTSYVQLHRGTRLGRGVTLHSGAVLGTDGFGYARETSGRLVKWPHVGDVQIEDDVEIGSGTRIDRGTMGSTLIRRGTKIDNLAHIAHNVQIGEDCFITPSIICGSTHIGDRVWVGAGAVIRERLRIGSDVFIGMGSVVTKDIPDGCSVMGAPACEIRAYARRMRALERISSAPKTEGEAG